MLRRVNGEPMDWELHLNRLKISLFLLFSFDLDLSPRFRHGLVSILKTLYETPANDIERVTLLMSVQEVCPSRSFHRRSIADKISIHCIETKETLVGNSNRASRWRPAGLSM